MLHMIGEMAQALRRRRRDELASAPTVDELVALGYDRGVSTAALRHLDAERAAGNLDCYRAAYGHGWNVWLPTRLAPETGGRRIELGDWVHLWIIGALPTGAGEGGDA